MKLKIKPFNDPVKDMTQIMVIFTLAMLAWIYLLHRAKPLKLARQP